METELKIKRSIRGKAKKSGKKKPKTKIRLAIESPKKKSFCLLPFFLWNFLYFYFGLAIRNQTFRILSQWDRDIWGFADYANLSSCWFRSKIQTFFALRTLQRMQPLAVFTVKPAILCAWQRILPYCGFHGGIQLFADFVRDAVIS